MEVVWNEFRTNMNEETEVSLKRGTESLETLSCWEWDSYVFRADERYVCQKKDAF